MVDSRSFLNAAWSSLAVSDLFFFKECSLKRNRRSLILWPTMSVVFNMRCKNILLVIRTFWKKQMLSFLCLQSWEWKTRTIGQLLTCFSWSTLQLEPPVLTPKQVVRGEHGTPFPAINTNPLRTTYGRVTECRHLKSLWYQLTTKTVYWSSLPE